MFFLATLAGMDSNFMVDVHYPTIFKWDMSRLFVLVSLPFRLSARQSTVLESNVKLACRSYRQQYWTLIATTKLERVTSFKIFAGNVVRNVIVVHLLERYGNVLLDSHKLHKRRVKKDNLACFVNLVVGLHFCSV